MNALMTDFRDGALLGVADGTTLRGFLAKKVHCGVKRISKKLEGTSYNGRLTFKVKHQFAAGELRYRCARLALLQANFEQSVETLKVKESQKGDPVGEPREGETDLPPQASRSIQDNSMLRTSFAPLSGASVYGAACAEARARLLLPSYLNSSHVSGFRADTTRLPGLYKNHGVTGLAGRALPPSPVLPPSPAMDNSQFSMDQVLSSIPMRRSAIVSQPFGNTTSAPSTTSLAAATLVRPAVPGAHSGSALQPLWQHGASSQEISATERLLASSGLSTHPSSDEAEMSSLRRSALLLGLDADSVVAEAQARKRARHV